MEQFAPRAPQPFPILDLRFEQGRIGIATCPGKVQADAGIVRDLEDDLDTIALWGATSVLCLLHDRELIAFGLAVPNVLPDLAKGVLLRRMNWFHVPLRSKGIPDLISLASIEFLADQGEASMRAGGRLLIHCDSGLGRSGMVAAIVLTRMGENPARAIERVRSMAGPEAIPTLDQEKVVYVAHARRVAARRASGSEERGK